MAAADVPIPSVNCTLEYKIYEYITTDSSYRRGLLAPPVPLYTVGTLILADDYSFGWSERKRK